MAPLTAINEVVEKYKGLGYKRLSSGTQLVGHVPHVAAEAYLFVIFAPLTTEQIGDLERKIHRSLPEELKRLYHFANGMWLFSGALSIDGLRLKQSRSGDDAYQPFSIEIPNIDERPPDAKEAYIFFGGYDWDGSLLYIDVNTNKVFRCSRDSVKPLNEWKDLHTMLTMEVIRLAKLFDDRGRQIDSELPTIP